jgi:ankyrin repeat protein
MAVPGRRNGLLGDDDDQGDALFEVEDEGLVDLDVETPPHLRDLASAAQLGDVAALSASIDNLNGSIDEAVEDGDTALHLACLYGYLPCVQLLLQRGANLEVKDEEGGLALHDACAGGFTEIVRLLVNHSNDPECVKRMLGCVDAEGDTPLHHAARGEHVDIVRFLLASGASPTKTNSYGKTPCELVDPETEIRRVLEDAVSASASH